MTWVNEHKVIVITIPSVKHDMVYHIESTLLLNFEDIIYTLTEKIYPNPFGIPAFISWVEEFRHHFHILMLLYKNTVKPV